MVSTMGFCLVMKLGKGSYIFCDFFIEQLRFFLLTTSFFFITVDILSVVLCFHDSKFMTLITQVSF